VVGVTLDISDTKRVEEELRAKLDLIERQQRVIRALSTPIIQVWDSVLTLPMVGVIDSARAAEIMQSLLNEVVRTRARYAILDMTGVDAIDTATASHLLSLIRAIQLLGAEGIVTGLQPSIAHTIVGLGLDLSDILTLATLREGLKLCMRKMSGG
jgi:rsbT co-antagonist protein RsbR